MKVLHIINSLNKGGAEGNLYRLCAQHKKKFKKKIDITVLTLIKNGFYENELKKRGVNVFSLDINKENKIIDIFKKIILFRKFVKKINPNIIQSWMYHSNFLSILLPKNYYYNLFWNIRHSELNFKISKKKTILLSVICGFFSRLVPKKILYCSDKSIKFHEKTHFYAKQKRILINNGYSEKDYYSSISLRQSFRKKYKIKSTDIILGYAGRYAKQKNIESLLHAYSMVSRKYKNIYLYMVGKNIDNNNNELINTVLKLNIKNKVFFLNEQKDLLKFYNGIDLLLLTSHSESFPNVIAEAMLCSTLVLASDAGCSKKIINKNGFVLKKNDHITILKVLKKSIKIFLNQRKHWSLLKKNAQIHIKKNFSLEKMADDYLKNWLG